MNARVVLLTLVAACGPRWTLEDRTTPRDLELGPGMTTEQTFAVESSHPIATVRTVAENISLPSGKIRVAHRDSREGCSAASDFEGRERKWNTVPASRTVSITDDRLELAASCPATQHATQVRVSFTNASDAPVSFRFQVVALANGDGSDEPPSDAFVRIRPAE